MGQLVIVTSPALRGHREMPELTPTKHCARCDHSTERQNCRSNGEGVANRPSSTQTTPQLQRNAHAREETHVSAAPKTKRWHVPDKDSFKVAGELARPDHPGSRSPPDDAAEAHLAPLADASPPYLSPAHPQVHRRKPWRRIFARNITGQSGVSARNSTQREEGSGNAGTSTENTRAA